MLKKFNKRLVSLVSSLAILTSVFAALGIAADAAQVYTDVPPTHWAYSYIERCSKTNWFSGYPDGTFHPDDTITRAEALKVFVTFLSEPLKEVTVSSYHDVSPTAWYAPFVEAGKELFPQRKTLDGQNKFQPEMPVTREDVMYGIVVALGYDAEMQFVDQSILNMYRDQNSITESVKPYIAEVTKLGVVDGNENNEICAQDPLTRAQFAKLLAAATDIGPYDVSDRKKISSIDVYPSVLESMLVGDSVEVMAVANYTDGSKEDYSENVNPYTDSSEGVITINKNKITAIGEGTVIVKFNNENLKDMNLVVTVKDSSSAPVIQISDYSSSVTGESTTITGKVADESGSGVGLSCNGSAIILNPDGTFSVNLNLTSGMNSFEFKAVNGAKKEASKTVEIRRIEPTPEPTAEPTPEPAPEPTAEPTPEPVYDESDPVIFEAKLIKKPSEDDRTAVIRISYSGLTTAKVTSAKFVLEIDDDIYTYNASKSSSISKSSMRYQSIDEGVRFSFNDSDGCTDKEHTLAEIALDVDEEYDLESVNIMDFFLKDVSLKNGTASFDESNIIISLE